MSLLKDEWINKEEGRPAHAIRWLENYRYHKAVVCARVRDDEECHQVSRPARFMHMHSVYQAAGQCRHVLAVKSE